MHSGVNAGKAQAEYLHKGEQTIYADRKCEGLW